MQREGTPRQVLDAPTDPWARRSTRQSDNRPDIADALNVLMLRKWSVVMVTILVFGVSLLATSQQAPKYSSEASVVVLPIDPPGVAGPPIEPNMATEEELVESEAVATLVAENIDADVPARNLLDNLTVTNPTETEILDIGYTHTDPEVAAQRAQAFADGYLEYRRRSLTRTQEASVEAAQREIEVLRTRLREIEGRLSGLDETSPLRGRLEAEAELLQTSILQRQLEQLDAENEVQLGNVVRPATVPGKPSSPNVVLNGAFGLIAGLALGIGLAFLRERLAGRLRSLEEVEQSTGSPIFATVPRVRAWRKKKDAFLITRGDLRSPATEAYRALRTNVLSVASINDIKSVVVTSPQVAEGKSSTSANLATVLVRAGKDVILVSADLRRPRLHEFFDAPHGPGLAEVLAGRLPVEDALVKIGGPAFGMQTMRFLPSGTADHPSEVLASGDVRGLIDRLEGMADIVIFDSAPVLPVTDALVLAPLVGGVLLVLSSKSITVETVSKARQQIERVGAPILGTVLNAAEPSMADVYEPY